MTAFNVSRATLGTALSLLGGLVVACADSPTAPSSHAAPSAAPSAAATTAKNTFAITTVGDTTIAQIGLVAGARGASYFIGGNQHLDLPGGAELVCDLQTSSYGAGTWDAGCTPQSDPVTITARSWTDASGAAHTEFSPALRFVPSSVITLTLNSRQGVDLAQQRILYCSATGCVDEAVGDPSVATRVLSGTQLTRRVKHFSGYNVVVD